MRILLTYLVVLKFSFLSLSCFKSSSKKESRVMNTYKPHKHTKVAYFAGGCFWCVEAVFESVKGVEEAISGYAGGHTLNPSYESIGSGKTGHAEAVAVYYNPKIVSFKTLVEVFFGSHDPTTVNSQGPDYGTQYRSIAFYSNKEEKKIIDDAIYNLNKTTFNNKIATQIIKIKKFYKAEDYHQDFEKRNPNHSYIRAVSIPRINKFKMKFPKLLKNKKD